MINKPKKKKELYFNNDIIKTLVLEPAITTVSPTPGGIFKAMIF
jgi:hypothetical protein